MGAPAPEVAYVDVQRRRILGELQQRSRTSERGRVVEQVDQCHHRQDPTAAPRARRHRRSLEPAGEREELARFGGVEHHVLAVGIEDDQVGNPDLGA